MEIKIYQINPERDTHNVMYNSYDAYCKKTRESKIDRKIYDVVYEGKTLTRYNPDTVYAFLEDVYAEFNSELREGFSGRLISRSDLIETLECDRSGLYYCDKIGFRKVEFASDERASEPETAVKAQNVTKIIEEVAGKICDDYCKYRAEYDCNGKYDDETYDSFTVKYCDKCPINRLL